MADSGEQLHDLPIFPLPGAVLFPGAVLPLHVFEPRYVEMTSDALAGEGLIAIANLDDGAVPDEQGRPAVHVIATVGSIVGSQEMPENRYGILVHGRDRIRIESELPQEHLYRTVVARVLDGRALGDAGGAERVRPQLVSLCDQLSMHFDDGGDQLRELVRVTEDPATLADAVASALINEPADRQKLLENLDPVSRLEDLLGHVSELLISLRPRSTMPN